MGKAHVVIAVETNRLVRWGIVLLAKKDLMIGKTATTEMIERY